MAGVFKRMGNIFQAKANKVLNAKKGASMVPGKKPIDQKTLGSMKQSLNFK